MKKFLLRHLLSSIILIACSMQSFSQNINDMWNGDAKAKPIDGSRGKIFREGRYAMFIHFGYYSFLADQWNGKTSYGISEWLMHKDRANIPVKDYMAGVGSFDPIHFNADSIAALAKNAGMRYIIVTSKHHDGFAMFRSKASKFNIWDATPFRRDPMKELAQACKKAELGFGFYYSQNLDWTTPGGDGGPTTYNNGRPATYDEYFNTRCLPEIEQITTEYGPLALVWFDMPSDLQKKSAATLVETVHKNQPGAYVSGRIGYNLGDYTTLGDMEVPSQNVSGLWESVDVTNDSWGYAWYDENWKSPQEILTRMLSTIARGGNYMLNVGPDKNGVVPKQATEALRSSGNWVKKHPDIIYKSKSSPWKHAMPWGDAVVNGNKISLLVYDWPVSGKLYVPGLQSAVKTIHLLNGNLLTGQAGKKIPLNYKKEHGWVVINIPDKAPEKFVSVIELMVEGTPKVDTTLAIDPQWPTLLDPIFAQANGCNKSGQAWMEKHGEWKHADRLTNWKSDGSATWTIDILKPGYYQSLLKYTGKSRLVWRITVNNDKFVQNQQSASGVYHWYPIGWLYFDKPGRYQLSVSLIEGDGNTSSLTALQLEPVEF